MFMFAVLILASVVQSDTAPARIAVHPVTPLIEHTRAGQEVNFDFLVTSTSADTIDLRGIEVSAFDADGRLLLRRFLDDNGSSPSIETVPRRTLAPGAHELVFNPFHTFDDDVDLTRLRYRFSFAVGKATKVIELDVRPADFQPKTRLRLPLEGRVIVYDGHDYYAHHRRLNFADRMGTQLGISANFMRYAFDFIAVDSTGAMTQGDEARNEAWLGWGARVLAPAGGRIVQLHDGDADNRQIDMSAVMRDPLALYGNYIVIDHLNGEFSMLAHIRQGSARVKLGDMVTAGQHIASVGASGSAFMPHLHYELRSGPGIRGVEGLPAYFEDYVLRRGARTIDVQRGVPGTGDIAERR